MHPFVKSIKAVRYLGFSKLWFYALYQVGLRTGHYRRVTPCQRDDFSGVPALGPYPTFPNIPQAQIDQALAEADEIRRGYYRPFGGKPVLLDLDSGASPDHWSTFERSPTDQDIKIIWEPGRFGWAITLARAYAFSGAPEYAKDFWDKTLHFLKSHPPNSGRQWQSAQEVAIRLMALVFCDRVLATAPSTTQERRTRLWQSIAEHARRIPPTLVYARAQNNNHLLSEAAGLYTAGLYLRDHPRAASWRKIGRQWLNWGFQNQINETGTYIQHSVNYHRLMLQLALYSDHLRRAADEHDWSLAAHARLDAATRWLWALTDSSTGQAPDLGANDGAFIFPLTSRGIEDYRPVVDAAAKAFLGFDIYEISNLSEMAQWFNLTAPPQPAQRQPHAPDMLRVESEAGRAFLHTAHFTDRPSHADQLHVDLWWRGINVALDPGTYQYSAAPPWDNALATARVHNTLTLDNRDQMTWAGRFLWLDWAQAQVLAHETDELGQIRCLTAEHYGFRKSGAIHQRTLTRTPNGWDVSDIVLPYGQPDQKSHTTCLSWLVPDWQWQQVDPFTIRISGPDVTFNLSIAGGDQIELFQGGVCLLGKSAPDPTWGWTSPIYGEKQPALMIRVTQTGHLPLKLLSSWQFMN